MISRCSLRRLTQARRGVAQIISPKTTRVLLDHDHGRIQTTPVISTTTRDFNFHRYQNKGNKPHKSNNDDDDDRPPPMLIPYSQSLPEPGHDWCPRCEIRCRKFQKPVHVIGKPGADACAQLPDNEMCAPAWRYFTQQRDLMLGIMAVVFVVPGAVNFLLGGSGAGGY